MNVSGILTVTMLAFVIQISGCADPHDVDGDGYVNGDCAPDDGTRHPSAPETPYDGIDQDCDGLDLVDMDGDGVPGPLAGGNDCDDVDSMISPLAIEVPYDGIDQDCWGGDLRDLDRDSFESVIVGGTDCDDNDPTIHSGTVELADGRDQNCNGIIDETTTAFDDDRDGYSEADGDCNDLRPEVHPGAQDIPGNMIDEDCNNGDLTDLDGDGFSGELYGGPDCDDSNPSIHPGAAEVPDQLDNNCNSSIDEHTTIYDDDGDGYSESGGDCNDYNALIHPGANEATNGLDDDCDGEVDEPVLAFPSPVIKSFMAATASGPRSSTPGDIVYRPTPFIAMYVRYIVRDASGVVRDLVDVLARPPLSARYGFAAAPVGAYALPDGSFRWIVAGAPVPSGAVEVGKVEIASSIPFSAPVPAGYTIERWYMGVDSQGHRALQPGTSLPIASTAQTMIEETGAPLSLHGVETKTLELPTFAEGDLLLMSNQEQEMSTDDDWAYDCIPSARSGGGIQIDCHSDYASNSGKSVFARIWHAPPPFQVRCVTTTGGTTSCAVPPTIVVTNNQRWTAFVECPVGYRCLTVVTPAGEWTGTDDDVGWAVDIEPIDPLRDLGVGGIASVAAAGSVPAGYVANLHGDMVQIDVHGGNNSSYARFIVAQLLVPAGIPVSAMSRTFRSVDPSGMSEAHAICLPSSSQGIIAPVVTTYDPHYEPGPSLISRIGGVLNQLGTLGQSIYDLNHKVSIANAIDLVKNVIGFIGALFSLGDPHEDDAAIVDISLTQNASDPTCIDLTTSMVNVPNDALPVAQGVTLYSVFEQP